jgi:hypothetical protein
MRHVLIAIACFLCFVSLACAQLPTNLQNELNQVVTDKQAQDTAKTADDNAAANLAAAQAAKTTTATSLVTAQQTTATDAATFINDFNAWLAGTLTKVKAKGVAICTQSTCPNCPNYGPPVTLTVPATAVVTSHGEVEAAKGPVRATLGQVAENVSGRHEARVERRQERRSHRRGN